MFKLENFRSPSLDSNKTVNCLQVSHVLVQVLQSIVHTLFKCWAVALALQCATSIARCRKAKYGCCSALVLQYYIVLKPKVPATTRSRSSRCIGAEVSLKIPCDCIPRPKTFTFLSFETYKLNTVKYLYNIYSKYQYVLFISYTLLLQTINNKIFVCCGFHILGKKSKILFLEIHKVLRFPIKYSSSLFFQKKLIFQYMFYCLLLVICLESADQQNQRYTYLIIKKIQQEPDVGCKQ